MLSQKELCTPWTWWRKSSREIYPWEPRYKNRARNLTIAMLKYSNFLKKMKIWGKGLQLLKSTLERTRLLRFRNSLGRSGNWKIESSIWNKRQIIGLSFNKQGKISISKWKNKIRDPHKIAARKTRHLNRADKRQLSTADLMMTMSQSDPWWSMGSNMLNKNHTTKMICLDMSLLKGEPSNHWYGACNLGQR